VVGLLLLLGLLTVVARAVWQARAAAPSPELWAGAAGGLAALTVHSGFDFLWHLPAIPLFAALLLALTHPAIQPHHTKPFATAAGLAAHALPPAGPNLVATAADQ
jgi:hypothetical protein